LEKQLKEIEDERQRAQDQKQRLLKASNARLGPSVLAKHRYALRKQRPSREQVHDEVHTLELSSPLSCVFGTRVSGLPCVWTCERLFKVLMPPDGPQ
jgi:hypothetical protein